MVQPDGTGGTVVAVPVSADATSGEGDERLPLAESVALDGPAVLEREAGIALSLSFDSVEVADAARLTELLGPIGDVAVELPADVTDLEGDVVAAAGAATFDAAQLAAVLTARDTHVPAAEQYAAAAAVWAGVADAVGEGLDGAPPGGADAIERDLALAMSGPLVARALATSSISADRNPRGVDVALLDRAELALVFGQIAPGRVSAPSSSLSFRVVASFSAAQLGDRGWTNAEVAYRAISQLQFLRSNVLSVDTTPAQAPTATQLELNDATLNMSGVRAVFGDVVLVEPTTRLVGVDAILILGTEYLRFLDDVEALPGQTAGTVTDADGADVDDVEPVASTDVTENDVDTTETDETRAADEPDSETTGG